MTKALENVPPFDGALECLILSAMIAWPECAKVAVEELEITTFYVPLNRTAFDRLSVQFCRNGICDAEQLKQDIPGNDEYVYTLENKVLRISGPSAIHGYCESLIAIEKRRKGLQAAGVLVSGCELSEVAEVISDLSSGGRVETCEAAKVERQIEDEITGERRSIAFPNWPSMSTMQMFLPGTLSVLCGSPGVSKSFFALEPLWRWHGLGENVAALELESGATFHLRRALAQMAGCSNLTRASWCLNNPDDALNTVQEFSEKMNSLKTVIQSPASGDVPTCDYLMRWIRKQFQNGARIVVIDPITMMATTSSYANKEHEKFVAEAKNLAARFSGSVMVVTHPKRGMPGHPISPCLENLPNSSAYERFSDTILWLEWVAETEEVFKVPAPGVSQLMKVNRLMHCLKVRLDVNPKRIGFWFDGNTLRHVECGRFAEE